MKAPTITTLSKAERDAIISEIKQPDLEHINPNQLFRSCPVYFNNLLC